MKAGLFAFSINPLASPEYLALLGRAAEERGFSTIWLAEHVVTFDEHRSRCPYTEDGRLRLPPGTGFLEPFTALAFLAAVTADIRLGTAIAILPQRQPLYTAKEVAGLDWLSGGRVDLGVGLGWSREELEACGVSWARRGARCDEYLALLRTLWTHERPSFVGQFYQLPACRFDPKPKQPRVPIHIGGESEAAMRRVARFGDGWLGLGLDPDGTAARLERLDIALRAAGRTRAEVSVRVSPHQAYTPPPTPEEFARFADLGVDELIVWCTATSTDDLEPALDVLAAAYLG
ncbi:MAG TPA: LLM class F420-dependent oxidoreductase [Pseudonocardia sp.]|jgi:probable F420-dependent oxidoreductase